MFSSLLCCAYGVVLSSVSESCRLSAVDVRGAVIGCLQVQALAEADRQGLTPGVGARVEEGSSEPGDGLFVTEVGMPRLPCNCHQVTCDQHAGRSP